MAPPYHFASVPLTKNDLWSKMLKYAVSDVRRQFLYAERFFMKSPLKKIRRMNEAAWLLGILLCALGVALCTKASFGLSMIAAPPYILHLKISQFLPWYTQGMSEYIWQFLLLILTCLAVQRIRWQYLLSFGTAILFGFSLDGWLWLLGGGTPYDALWARIAAFAAGSVITSLAVAFFFRTKLPLEIYELTVAEIADRYKLPIHRVKQIYDVLMLAISLLFALLLLGSFTGIGIGTVITTLINSTLVTFFGKLLDRFFTFEPRFPKFTEKLSK